ncbi:MAG: xanthine dehydrogenase family protein subunit M, partial [Candidatus Binatota bacterium]|nr:xanthine dehydrogenase family protein subunit M [Candidatus Binatota bacterium]
FDLVEPKSLSEACTILANGADAKTVAGGTALLTIIKQGLLLPKVLVNLKKISDASAITFDPVQGLRIGALATINEIETSETVRTHYPALAEACHVVANIRIRNMATLGGNLAHGDYQSDPPTVLAALDARVELINAGKLRQLALTDFQLGCYETALQPGELLAAVVIPPLPVGMTGHYVKFTTGSSEERPCAGVAALARIEKGICQELRLAVGAVSATPLRIAAEKLATGKALSADLIVTIAAEAARSIDPIDDVRGPADYKRHLVGVLTRRALQHLANGRTETTS